MNDCFVQKCLFEIPVLVYNYRFILENIHEFYFDFQLLTPLVFCYPLTTSAWTERSILYTLVKALRPVHTCRYKCKEVN